MAADKPFEQNRNPIRMQGFRSGPSRVWSPEQIAASDKLAKHLEAEWSLPVGYSQDSLGQVFIVVNNQPVQVPTPLALQPKPAKSHVQLV